MVPDAEVRVWVRTQSLGFRVRTQSFGFRVRRSTPAECLGLIYAVQGFGRGFNIRVWGSGL